MRVFSLYIEGVVHQDVGYKGFSECEFLKNSVPNITTFHHIRVSFLTYWK